MKIKGIFYKSLEENPEEPYNYCILERNEFEHEFDQNITVKDFIYFIVNQYCYECNYGDICCEMISFLKKNLNLDFL